MRCRIFTYAVATVLIFTSGALREKWLQTAYHHRPFRPALIYAQHSTLLRQQEFYLRHSHPLHYMLSKNITCVHWKIIFLFFCLVSCFPKNMFLSDFVFSSLILTGTREQVARAAQKVVHRRPEFRNDRGQPSSPFRAMGEADRLCGVYFCPSVMEWIAC